jgi:hypothetical protein
MASTDDLDGLGSQELHDRAFRYARRHLDARFFLRLVEMVPAAQAADGDATDSGNDVLHPSNQIAEAVDQDPQLMDALRPVYLGYLREHPEA